MNKSANILVPSQPLRALRDKIVVDICPGTFEPIYIYSLLTVVKWNTAEKGQQEDGDYLGFVLNGLHEIVTRLRELLSPIHEKTSWFQWTQKPLDQEQEDTNKGSENKRESGSRE